MTFLHSPMFRPGFIHRTIEYSCLLVVLLAVVPVTHAEAVKPKGFPYPANYVKDELSNLAFKDATGRFIQVPLPTAINTAAAQKRFILGNHAGSLYHAKRRQAIYRQVILDVVLMPSLNPKLVGKIAERELRAGKMEEDVLSVVSKVLTYGPNAVNGRYVAGGTWPADLHNQLATVKRKLNAAGQTKGLGTALIVVDSALETKRIVSEFLLAKAAATDLAARRLAVLNLVMIYSSGLSTRDRALLAAMEDVKREFKNLRSTTGWKQALDVLNREYKNLLKKGAAGVVATKFKATPMGMVLGSGLWGIDQLSEHHNDIQRGIVYAKLVQMIESSGRQSRTLSRYPEWRIMHMYAQSGYHQSMKSAYSNPLAKISDVLKPGHASKDVAEFHKKRLDKAEAQLSKAAGVPVLEDFEGWVVDSTRLKGKGGKTFFRLVDRKGGTIAYLKPSKFTTFARSVTPIQQVRIRGFIQRDPKLKIQMLTPIKVEFIKK